MVIPPLLCSQPIARTAARRALVWVGLGVSLVTFSGCGGGDYDSSVSLSASAAAAPALEIVEPQAQLMPGMGAVYLRIVNSGDLGDRLVSIETPIADVTEAHESMDDDGVMRMVAHPDGFAVPAGGTLDLVPGGKHVMLIDPRPLAEGETAVPLTLHFESSGAIEVAATVTGIESMSHDGMGH